MEQPQYAPGDHVRSRGDNGKWNEAWIVEVVPTYRYTIRYPAKGLYKGTPIRGLLVDQRDIRKMEDQR